MKLTILLIDDHLPSRSLTAQALKNEGFEVVGEASSGRSSVSLVKAKRPDAILMAVGLSDLDGISAAQKIMEEIPSPVILVTSHYENETIERAKEAGVMAYLIKPVRQEELHPTIELAISRFTEFISLRKQNADLKKTLETRKAIERAKGILMKSRGLSEAEAFALIQKRSMDTRKSMAEIARAVVLTEDMASENRIAHRH